VYGQPDTRAATVINIVASRPTSCFSLFSPNPIRISLTESIVCRRMWMKFPVHCSHTTNCTIQREITKYSREQRGGAGGSMEFTSDSNSVKVSTLQLNQTLAKFLRIKIQWVQDASQLFLKVIVWPYNNRKGEFPLKGQSCSKNQHTRLQSPY